MRTFQTICVALSVAAARAQVLSTSRSFGSSGLSYGSGRTYTVGSGNVGLASGGLTTSYSSGPAVSYGNFGGYSVGSPSVSVSRTVSSAPAVSYSAAAPAAAVTRVSTVSAPAAAVSYGVAAPAAVSYGARYSTVSAAPAVSYGVSRGVSYGVAAPAAVSYGVAAPAATVSYGVAAAPAVTRVHAVSAAPAVSYGLASRSYSVAAPAATLVHAAPAVSTVHAAPAVSTVHHGVGQAVNVGVVAQAPSATVKTHEVHTSSGQQAIRIEDFQAGDQVIRVHEGPQAAPEVAQIAVPGEHSHVRVVEHGSGPAHIERTVHRAETQVIDLQKAGRPGARIVQVVRGQSPAPSVEFVSANQGGSHHVYYADDVSGAGAVAGATTFHSAYAPAVSGAVVSAPAVSTVHHAVSAAPAVSYGVAAAPAATVSYGVAAAPAVSYATRSVVAAPAVTRVHAVSAAPAVSYGVAAAPAAVSYGVAAPVSTGYYTGYNPGYYGSYSLGGFRYGGLGYSTGYSSYGTGNNVYLKKSAAKKSA